MATDTQNEDRVTVQLEHLEVAHGEVSMVADRLPGRPGFAELATACELAHSTITLLEHARIGRTRLVAQVAWTTAKLGVDAATDTPDRVARRCRLTAMELATMCGEALAGREVYVRGLAVQYQLELLRAELASTPAAVGGTVPA